MILSICEVAFRLKSAHDMFSVAVTSINQSTNHGIIKAPLYEMSWITDCLTMIKNTIGPINSAMKHSLEFAVNRALFKIFGALSKDTYKDICKYFCLLYTSPSPRD